MKTASGAPAPSVLVLLAALLATACTTTPPSAPALPPGQALPAAPAIPGAAATYEKRQDGPTGTHLRETLEISNLPPDRSWEQLTPDQQAIVRNAYEDLPATDEPPYPLDGITAIGQKFAMAMKGAQQGGRLNAVAFVDASGDVHQVGFWVVPDADTQSALVYALTKTRFKPGRCNGQPCAMQFPYFVELKVDP